MSNQSGTGNGCPSQDLALIKTRREVKQLEEALRKPPKWAKPNKDERQKKQAKKRGPKFGHKPSPRTVPVVTARYYVGWAYCKCCRKQVPARNQLSGSKYGPRLHAQVCYWKFSLGLTLGKIQSLLVEQHQLEISTGVLSEMLTRSAKQFDGAYEDLGTSLLSQSHLHADETGWRNDGDNAWLWSFSNQDVSYYVIDRSRGQKVVKDILGESYSGVLITDFFGSYHEIDCEKQKCWTHLLRDLRELKKKYPKSALI